jgi:manganese transport protein
LKMGAFASAPWVKILAWITSAVIILLNGKLVFDQLTEWIGGGAPVIVSVLTVGVAGAITFFLAYLILLPLFRRQRDWKEAGPSGATRVIEGIRTLHSRHIAAALGRDDSDAAIVSRALSMAKAEGALLTLIHVADSASSQVYSSGVYDEHTREDEKYLTEIAEELRAAGIAAEIALLHGDPSKEIIKYAASHKVDMLVMGSHGHRLLGDLLLGETVDPVRHGVDIPVMVVR